MTDTVYTLKDAWDGVTLRKFVSNKQHCDLLALQDYFELADDLNVTVTVDEDTVTVRDVDGVAQIYYIQTIKRLV